MKKSRLGLTLIELIVVVAILAVLAMIVLPKLDGLQGNANHAVGAASADDTGRYIQIYKVQKSRLPDGYDSLMDGTNLWAPANPATPSRGLHNQLSGSAAKLTASVLTTTEAAALNNAGIYTLYGLGNNSATTRPGDMFNTTTTIAAGTPVAAVNATNGVKIINHIYRDNLKTGGVSGTMPVDTRLIAVGFGPHNVLIGKTMMETPAYPNVDATLVYNRNLVIFEVGTKAVFKAVVGADGDLLDDLTTHMNKDVQ